MESGPPPSQCSSMYKYNSTAVTVLCTVFGHMCMLYLVHLDSTTGVIMARGKKSSLYKQVKFCSNKSLNVSDHIVQFQSRKIARAVTAEDCRQPNYAWACLPVKR